MIDYVIYQKIVDKKAVCILIVNILILTPEKEL